MVEELLSLEEFKDFCHLDCNRSSYLHRLLSKKDIPFKGITNKDAYNFLILPGAGNPKDFDRLYVAHYDRIKGTYGANDNSAAVFQLIKHALLIQRQNQKKNTAILLTDLEEFHFHNRHNKQGSYYFAKEFEQAPFMNHIFVFDMCGIGDHIIWSKTFHKAFNNDALERTRQRIRKQVITSSYPISMNRLPFSDDLGFFQAGHFAQLISLLPQEELDQLSQWQQAELPKSKPDNYLQFKKHDHSLWRKTLPDAWKVNHTIEDTFESLTQESFDLMGEFLSYLSDLEFA
ncbi:M28 family peptidase [Spirochaeta cellobiosiphila]|uniref:M28 family peptidase n=1 Tax=Spirochaeta cellobiosiphila TaxID=504483 RepID=UPI000420B7B3|nr:M28 family peptidase [Spirochaeta cellobiosiphila]